MKERYDTLCHDLKIHLENDENQQAKENEMKGKQ